LLAVEGHVLEPHAQREREPVRELGVEADRGARAVQERPRDRAGIEADADAALASGSRSSRVPRAGGGSEAVGWETSEDGASGPRGWIAAKHLGARRGIRQRDREQQPRAQQERRDDQDARAQVAREPRPLDPDPPGDEAGAEDRDRERVHRRGHRAEAAVQHARHHEELEQVGRQVREVEQERDRRVDASEHGEQAGARERGVEREVEAQAGVPGHERHEAEAQELRE
jgi:hypothetical protein